jgi:hypothetical protein
MGEERGKSAQDKIFSWRLIDMDVSLPGKINVSGTIVQKFIVWLQNISASF